MREPCFGCSLRGLSYIICDPCRKNKFNSYQVDHKYDYKNNTSKQTVRDESDEERV